MEIVLLTIVDNIQQGRTRRVNIVFVDLTHIRLTKNELISNRFIRYKTTDQ